MENNIKKQNIATINTVKAYQKPQFTCYGFVRDVTLGGSDAGTDSGGGNAFSLKTSPEGFSPYSPESFSSDS